MDIVVIILIYVLFSLLVLLKDYIKFKNIVRTVPLDRKCRVIIDYDPALPKVSIETLTDKSDKVQVQEKHLQ